MNVPRLQIRGKLMGRREKPSADIVHIQQAIEHGPAENSFVLVEQAPPHRGRYISWIGYFDVEYASQREKGNWHLVEPGTGYQNDVEWRPYGWSGAERVPTIGDSILEQDKR